MDILNGNRPKYLQDLITPEHITYKDKDSQKQLQSKVI